MKSILIRLPVAVFAVTFLLWASFLAGPALADTGLKQTDVQKSYDLIVVGSDPEGVAAAVSGSRNGLSTLLVDTRPVPGGLMTQGWLNTIDMNYRVKRILNEGIFLEFFHRVEGDSFDVGTAQAVFNDLINAEDQLDLLLGVDSFAPLVSRVTDKDGVGAEVTGVRVDMPDGQSREIRAKRIIDATQDADLAAAAGVPYTFGQEDLGLAGHNMAVTLVFKLQGITPEDWLRISTYLNYQDKDPYSGANSLSAWGFGTEMEGYRPTNQRVNMRGLNLGRQLDGSVLVNALHIFGVDPENPASLEYARQLAERELPHIIRYLRNNIPGMTNVELGGVAPELYVRESRHIQAEYRLTIDDVLENRDFADRVAFGSYPVDIQSTGPGKPGLVVGRPAQYAIPFRCLVPLGVDGLLVVGRSAGYDSLAHGSARVIPVGMATGQAAGAAAALSVQRGQGFRELAASSSAMEELQARLQLQGVVLEPFQIVNRLAAHPAYEGLQFMRSLGLAYGGYANDYRLDEDLTAGKFAELLTKAARQAGVELPRPASTRAGEQVLSISEAASILARSLGQGLGQYNAYYYLTSEGYWNPENLQLAASRAGIVSNGLAYVIIRDFIAQLQLNQLLVENEDD